MRILVCLAVVTLAVSVSSAVQADRLSDHWQQQREYYNALAHRGCDGDIEALQELAADAQAGVPAAKALLGTVYRESNGCYGITPDDETWIILTAHAAYEGYPLAMSNLGEIFVRGDLGRDQNVLDGIYWLDLASEEGLAYAGRFLAELYAEGQFGVAQDLALAERYYDRAVANGLPREEQVALADLINRAAATRAPAAPSANVQNRPYAGQDTRPMPAGPSGIYQVTVLAPTNYSAEGNLGGVPQLGDYQQMGSNYALRVIYVAQAYGREPVGCWMAQPLFMVGWAYVDRSDYAQRTIDQLLESSNQAREAGNHRYVQNFRELPEGVFYVTENNGRIDNTQRPFMWSIVDANAFGPECAGSNYEVHYPAPVFGPE